MPIETWILGKLDAVCGASPLILRDPQRMIHQHAHIVDGWGEENGYTVLLCRGNLGLREMFEPLRNDASTRLLLVDQTRDGAKSPLFYPDLAAAAGSGQVTLTLCDFLVEKTGDQRWPLLVNERRIAELILANTEGTLHAYEQLQGAGGGHFSDSDLYRILLGAALHINPFKRLSPTEIRRLCVERHEAIERLRGILPKDAMHHLRSLVESAPKPFCWLLDRDPTQILCAFTLAAIMRQHGLDHRLLLSNLDPGLHDYRDIGADVLDDVMQDQLSSDPDMVLQDVSDAETFLCEKPDRLAVLLREQLGLDDPEKAFAALEREKLSPLVRSVALLGLLADLIEHKRVAFHKTVITLLDRQNAEAPPAVRRPSEQWQTLERAYRRALDVYALTTQMVAVVKKLGVMQPADLTFADFDQLWNEQRLNRVEYYLSDLVRLLRVGDYWPCKKDVLWPDLVKRIEAARSHLPKTTQAVCDVQMKIDTRFQELYKQHYVHWINAADGPVIFTHQFLPRVFKAHWDGQSGRKAVVLIFDGLRPDAWEEFVRPVLEEKYQIVANGIGSSLIPSETQLSRKALAGGCLPADFGSTNELKLLQAWLKTNMGLEPAFQIVVDDDSIASGISVRYTSDEIDYIIFGFTDKNLHGNPQELAFIYNSTVSDIIKEDVRSILRDLPDEAVVFVTSDHGFAEMPAKSVTIPSQLVRDAKDVRYRYASALLKPDADLDRQVVRFATADLSIERGPKPGTPARGFTLFPTPGCTLRRETGYHDPDKYSHGGISLAECMVPMIVMGPKQAQEQLLAIQSVRQVGGAAEGEDASLEVTLQPRQGGLPDTAITLTFSRPEIPTRRDIMGGRPLTLTIRWQPAFEITPADRERGTITLPLTVTVSYASGEDTVRLNKSAEVRIRLNPDRLRRRTDSKLDLMMGKLPKDLQS